MSEHEKRIVDEFSRQAEAISTAAVFNDATILDRIFAAARLTPASRALDVACGPGIVVARLARGCREAVGCDLTPAMLERARQRCAEASMTNTRFELGRAEALPFEDSVFDVVVSRSAVHHFANPGAAFREMARVVRSGGRVITVDVAASESAADAALHNALEILRDPSHVRMLPKSELHAALEQAGLRVEDAIAWTNHREFDEWMKISSAPERVGPLRVVMAALARAGASAGIALRVDGEQIRFEHHPALTVAIKR